MRVYDAGVWRGQTDRVSRLEVGTLADSIARLAVVAASSRFGHDSTGSHQMVINRDRAPETASIVFRTNWTGDAEVGPTGSGQFGIKVSDSESQLETAGHPQKPLVVY